MTVQQKNEESLGDCTEVFLSSPASYFPFKSRSNGNSLLEIKILFFTKM